MRKTLKVMYPEHFGRKTQKRKAPGFILRQWQSLSSYVCEIKTSRLILGTCVFSSLCIGIYTAYAYNHFTAFKQAIYTAKGNIEKEIQRREDLIHNLIPPTLNYLQYEKELFFHVVNARKELSGLAALGEQEQKALPALPDSLKSQLPSLTAVFENYPDLKASQPFGDLMKELIETENRVAKSREMLNEKVRIYNTYITKLPASMVAQALGYEKESWFKSSDHASVVPDMKELIK